MIPSSKYPKLLHEAKVIESARHPLETKLPTTGKVYKKNTSKNCVLRSGAKSLAVTYLQNRWECVGLMIIHAEIKMKEESIILLDVHVVNENPKLRPLLWSTSTMR